MGFRLFHEIELDLVSNVTRMIFDVFIIGAVCSQGLGVLWPCSRLSDVYRRQQRHLTLCAFIMSAPTIFATQLSLLWLNLYSESAPRKSCSELQLDYGAHNDGTV